MRCLTLTCQKTNSDGELGVGGDLEGGGDDSVVCKRRDRR